MCVGYIIQNMNYSDNIITQTLNLIEKITKIYLSKLNYFLNIAIKESLKEFFPSCYNLILS